MSCYCILLSDPLNCACLVTKIKFLFCSINDQYSPNQTELVNKIITNLDFVSTVIVSVTDNLITNTEFHIAISLEVEERLKEEFAKSNKEMSEKMLQL